MTRRFDLVVVGAGPGGHAAAERAARLGATVSIVENAGWGGTCTHRGCIPTKALLACSRAYLEQKKMARLGITTGRAVWDYETMKRHQAQMVKLAALGVEKTLHDAGVQMVAAEAIIEAPGRIRCRFPSGEEDILESRNTLVAWGSEPSLLPGVPLSERIFTSTGLLSCLSAPESLVIIGGNVIGVEFAAHFGALGVPVTVLEALDRLLPGEEPEAVTALCRELSRLGIKIRTAARVTEIREQNRNVTVVAQTPTEILNIAGSHALICIGRHPYLRRRELDALEIPYTEQGIQVDDAQRTAVAGISALGDVTGGPMLAHRAMQQGIVWADRLFGGDPLRFLPEALPLVVYSHPPLARVGLTEQEARKRWTNVDINRADYTANPAARIQFAGTGHVKLIFHRDRIVGATIVGPEASELIAPLGLALTFKTERRQLREWILPHPSLAEVLRVS